MPKKSSKPPSEASEQRIQWIPFELEALKEPAFGRQASKMLVGSLRSLPDAIFFTGIPALLRL